MNINMDNTAPWKVYALRPDRRFVGGFHDELDAKIAAEEQRGEAGSEVWHNDRLVGGFIQKPGNVRFSRWGVMDDERTEETA